VSELKNKIEAVLFASGKKVTYEDLARLCNTDLNSIKREIVILKKEYMERDSPLMFSEEADGLKLTVRETYLPVVHGLVPETELGKSLLETLAVVAWKQPVMQAELIKIRTNKAYEDVGELEEKGFISKERYGRSYILKTTSKFNEYFDLPGKEAIRKIFAEVQAEAEMGEQKRIEDYEKENKEKEMLGKLEVYKPGPDEQIIVEEESEEEIPLQDKKAEEPEKETEEKAEESSEEETQPEETEEKAEEKPKEREGRELSKELEDYAEDENEASKD